MLLSVGKNILRLAKFVAPGRFASWEKQINFIKSYYGREMKRDLNLWNPSRFSEKMQWRKLFEDSSLYTQFCDKIAVREYISEKGFSSMMIPQVWIGTDPETIPFDDFPRPFVFKSSHASGHVIIVKGDQGIDKEYMTARARRWVVYCHGKSLGEPGYLDVPHKFVVEPLLLCANGNPPAELKLFVFNGQTKIVQYVVINSSREHRMAYFTRDWQRYPWSGQNSQLENPEKPQLYELALTIAEKLCQNIDHCRVDLYLTDDRIYIGELTLYCWTGIVTLNPPEVDMIMGSFWTLKWPKTRAAFAMLTRNWGRA